MQRNIRNLTCHLTLFISLCVTKCYATQVSVAVFEEHQKYVKSARAYGISWKLLEKAANQQGIQLEEQPGSWKAGMSRLKAGKVDLVFYAIRSMERETWAVFSLPFLYAGSAIFTHHNNPVTRVDDIDFINASVGVSADSVQEVYAKQVGFQNIYSTVERNQLYKMLNLKRLDYLFFAIGVVDYYCTYYDPSRQTGCLKQVGEPYNKNTVHVMGKDTARIKQIIKRINQGMRGISQSADTRHIFNAYGVKPETYQNWRNELNSTPN